MDKKNRALCPSGLSLINLSSVRKPLVTKSSKTSLQNLPSADVIFTIQGGFVRKLTVDSC